MTPRKILIDTDPGDDVDDVLAIAFALLRSELDVRGITTVTGDTVKRAQIIGKLLGLVGRRDIPLGAGIPLPLRALDAAGRQRWMEITGYRLNHYPWVQPSDDLPDIHEDGIALMARIIREHPGEITLVAIGPLTNVAVLLRRYPEVIDKLSAIAIMGGELELNRRENNIVTDPVAADIVFTSGIPLFVGTWSVTRGFVLSPDDCAKIKAAGTPLTDGLSACIDLWWPHKAHKPGPVMYDIAPLLWSYDPSFYPTQSKRVLIALGDEATAGMTVTPSGEPNCEVSVSLDVERIRALYRETILSSVL
ncbi:MAG: nucleoside hydrolase [Armatimonadota bacterium]